MDKPGPTYPKREPYFAHRYCRLLTKSCAAQDIGANAFVLCVVIVHLEDSKRYKGPVTFYSGQLAPLIGVSKWEALDAARQRAVQAGWLYYAPGNRGQRQPGKYWATIPKGLDDLDDSPCDESHYPAKGEWTPTHYPAKGDRDGDREGDHSTLTLSLKKAPATAGDIPEGLLQLIDGWNGLGDSIVRKGNGAHRDPPAKAVLAGWKRAQKQPDQRTAFADIPAVLAAIQAARFCHGQGWFTLPWLFGSNKNREFNICRLLAGAHDGANGNGQPAKKPELIKYRA